MAGQIIFLDGPTTFFMYEIRHKITITLCRPLGRVLSLTALTVFSLSFNKYNIIMVLGCIAYCVSILDSRIHLPHIAVYIPFLVERFGKIISARNFFYRNYSFLQRYESTK